jgi:hypothetical protein
MDQTQVFHLGIVLSVLGLTSSGYPFLLSSDFSDSYIMHPIYLTTKQRFLQQNKKTTLIEIYYNIPI